MSTPEEPEHPRAASRSAVAFPRKKKLIEEAYNCFVKMWANQSVAASWKRKWLVPIPKGNSQKVQDVGPIMPVEVLRKLLDCLVVLVQQQVTNSLQ